MHPNDDAPRTGDAPSTPQPGSDVFSAADLEPPEWELAALRRARIDRAATTVAVTALGVFAGGLVALGACAAPMVFRLAPYPFSADAMGAAFQRFDAIAVGCALVALGAEVARTLLDVRARSPRPRPVRIVARVRRYVGMVLAALAMVGAAMLTPEILRLHGEGVRRGVGERGHALEATHRRAEQNGKACVALAVLLIGLHVFTLRSPRDEEGDDDAEAPLAPGPRG